MQVLILLLSLWSVLPALAAEEHIYTQLTRAVFRLQEHRSICIAGQLRSEEQLVLQGTGFFVQDFPGKDPVLWAITARHVVDGAKGDLIARVRLGSEKPREEWLYLPRAKWLVLKPGIKEEVVSIDNVVLPQQGFPIDVAVMPIRIVDGYKSFSLCNGDNCPMEDPPKAGRIKNQLQEDPKVPDHVLLFGFPQEGPDLRALEPFTRSGIVSYSTRDAQFRIGNMSMLDVNAYVIDAFGWPGNSGGPVMNQPSPFSSGVRLLGLLTGSHQPFHDYSIITPVSSILRTLRAARLADSEPVDGWRTNYTMAQRVCQARP
jgi:hypothetical protein